jgi:hypothetical protein
MSAQGFLRRAHENLSLREANWNCVRVAPSLERMSGAREGASLHSAGRLEMAEQSEGLPGPCTCLSAFIRVGIRNRLFGRFEWKWAGGLRWVLS